VLAKAPTPSWSWNRLSIDRRLDIIGVVLALTGLLTLLSLFSSTNGAVTGWWTQAVKSIAGWGSFVLPVTLILVGIWLVLRNVERLPMLSAERLTGLVLLYLNILAWMHMSLQLSGQQSGMEAARAGVGGGYIGAFFEVITTGALGRAGAVVTFSAWLLIAIALTLDISISEIFHFFQRILASLARRVNQRIAVEQASRQAALADASYSIPELDADGRPIKKGEAGVSSELPPDFRPLNTGPAAQPATSGPAVPGPRARGARPQPDGSAAVAHAAPAAQGSRASAHGRTPAASTPVSLPPWKLPDIAQILDPVMADTAKTSQDAERGKVIEDTLASFGAPVKVVAMNHGPTVTQFGVEPLYIETRNGQTRVRVSKIVALADDLALALAAPRIRIQAPVPGRNYVGVEVPNLEISRVMLRDVIESDAYRKLKTPLRFALGKDVAGHSRAYDLPNMPHLLIAGTTGSGKSVCVNSILTAFLINNTPNELRMILVDPKRVELTGYNGIPHLLAPVVVEAEQVVGALQWVQREMDARYHRFSQTGARNIVDYNARNSPPLPYMLVLIDELADLMMLAPDETERSLTRLAQLARATGIHLVIATQRPSVDVVTGLIKANFPARVAFAVASGTDSRVILDQPGAERLLGRGDMLFQAPDAAAPVRLQGVWVADHEIQRIVDYWRQQAYEMRDANLHTPTATPVNMDMPLNAPLRQTPLFGESEDGKNYDPIMNDAIKTVREEGKASISMLQRKLRIGYTRAARLIDRLEEEGIIGPAQPTSQVREVLDFGNENDAEADAEV
jgi:S-DNA-T family DNA segregation ATPase FtsK/SpoIIIE